MSAWMKSARGGRAAVAHFQVRELTIDGPSEGLPTTPSPLMSIMCGDVEAAYGDAAMRLLFLI